MSNELAIDDDDLRQLNTSKIVNTFEKASELIDEHKKTTKTTRIYLYAMLALIAVMIVGATLVVAVRSGGVVDFIDNYWIVDNINHRINCTTNNETMIFRTPQEAHYFQRAFNTTNCKLWEK